MMILAAKERATAESEASAAAIKLAQINQRSEALSEYTSKLATERVTGPMPAYDFVAHGKFMEVSLSALRKADEAREKSIEEQTAALEKLAAELERRDALEAALNDLLALTALTLSRQDDYSIARSTASSDSGNTGLLGLVPPDLRH